MLPCAALFTWSMRDQSCIIMSKKIKLETRVERNIYIAIVLFFVSADSESFEVMNDKIGYPASGCWMCALCANVRVLASIPNTIHIDVGFLEIFH